MASSVLGPPAVVCSLHSVYIGSDDGMVYAWSVDSGEQVATLDGGHPGPTTSVQFNPRFMTLASACTNVVSQLPFW